ncbi:hypothetical protein chiPu_0031795, partial [Chiloscyllium punctatum]|nr:hypothetical protein [Chiloscyllium punctatum]
RLASAEARQALQFDLERFAVHPKQHRRDLVGPETIDIADEAQGDVIIFGIDPACAGKATTQAGEGLADIGRNFQTSEQTRHRYNPRCLARVLGARTLQDILHDDVHTFRGRVHAVGLIDLRIGRNAIEEERIERHAEGFRQIRIDRIELRRI